MLTKNINNKKYIIVYFNKIILKLYLYNMDYKEFSYFNVISIILL